MMNTRGDDRLARDIVTWETDFDPDWLDAPGVTAAVRAGHVLVEGILHTRAGAE